MTLETILDLILKLTLGLSGVFVGSFLTRRKDKVSLAFDLHKELSGPEMSKHRKNAGALIRNYPMTNVDALDGIDRENAISIFIIIRFYQRVWLSIKHKRVDRKIASELFASNFYFWYYVYFKNNVVPLGGRSNEYLRELANWFKIRLPDEDHKTLITQYESECEKIIMKYKSDSGAPENSSGVHPLQNDK